MAMADQVKFRELRRKKRAQFLIAFLLILAQVFWSEGRAVAERPVDNFSLAGQFEVLAVGKGSEKSGAYVLEKGEEALLARSWLTQHAERQIDVQYFIWSTDNVGILASEALLSAAERGVKVRVIVDDLLIDAPDDSMLALAAHPNIDIKIYNPKHKVGVSVPGRIFHMLTDFRSFNQRMHDKTFMVDNLVAITGGRNMADEYFDYDHHYNFRDRDVLLLGPVVGAMGKSFENFWQSPLAVAVEKRLVANGGKAQQEKFKNIYKELHQYAADPQNYAPEVRAALVELPKKFPLLFEAIIWDEIEFLHDVPGKNDKQFGLGGGGQTTARLKTALEKAKSSITIQSPYLVMPAGAIDFFQALAAKGVQVKISTNSLASTDNLQAFSGYRKQRKKILQAGIKVFEFMPQPANQKELIDRFEALKKYVPTFAIHAKSMVIDGELLFVGTFNFDPRSANLNTEVGVLLENRELASQVEQNILDDMGPSNSWNTASDNPDSHASMIKRLKTTFWRVLPLSPLL